MAEFSQDDWTKIFNLLERDAARFGLPARRDDSLTLTSFNICKLGKVTSRSAGAWAFLAEVCRAFDLVAVQEVTDDLQGLNHLKSLLGEHYGMVASDITGGVAAAREGMTERLAFLFRWARLQRTEVASDITIDRSAVTKTLREHRTEIEAALDAYEKALARAKKKFDKKMADFEAGLRRSKPKFDKPPLVLPRFLTFIRTPYCVSFRVADTGPQPMEFLAVNAHLLFGHQSKQREEREMEFFGLMSWLVDRARQIERLYHKNLILFGDLNLDFQKVDARRARIETQLKELNGRQLAGARRAKVNFPFFDVHPTRRHIADPQQAIFRSNARLDQTYDQIGIFIHDRRFPSDKANDAAGTIPGGFDYGVFNFADLVAEALHGKPLAELSKAQGKKLQRLFMSEISDHMPIWIRLPKSAA